MILVIILCCHLYVNNFLLPSLKTDILSNTEQVSILRGELQDIKSYLDTTAIQLYALQEESVAQAEYIQGLIDQKAEHEAQLKAEHEKEIKLNREHDVVLEEDKGLGLKESVTVFTLTTLKGIKDKLWGWEMGW